MADRHFRHRLDTAASVGAGPDGPARWGRPEASMADIGAVGLSRRRVLTAGALAGATLLGTGLSGGKASAASKPAIFYSPHQDDEVLGLAGSILEHKAAGRPVYLVLVTRGENNQLAGIMNEWAWEEDKDTGKMKKVDYPCRLRPSGRCAAHGPHGVNWPTDPPSATDSVIVPSRTAEFMAAADVLGVDKVINLKVPDSAWNGDTDFKNFTKTVKSKIASIADQYPGASHKFTAGWLEVSATHKAISDAAVQLAKEGKLTDVRFNFVYAYDYPLASRRNGAAYVLNIPSDDMDTKRNAIACYNSWQPSKKLYALGYHSVPEKLESAAADPHEYVFGMPNDDYEYGDIQKDRKKPGGGKYSGEPQWGWS
ncbi:PIG-L family deacetylase [Kitasatospora sp. NPDC089797]|uniref:PIG-L deacetylase family protein n=1 Tax=Kitasatospora sp. NPDC089797 TaxID=3155298 RepID=UPI00342B9BF9